MPNRYDTDTLPRKGTGNNQLVCLGCENRDRRSLKGVGKNVFIAELNVSPTQEAKLQSYFNGLVAFETELNAPLDGHVP